MAVEVEMLGDKRQTQQNPSRRRCWRCKRKQNGKRKDNQHLPFRLPSVTSGFFRWTHVPMRPDVFKRQRLFLRHRQPKCMEWEGFTPTSARRTNPPASERLVSIPHPTRAPPTPSTLLEPTPAKKPAQKWHPIPTLEPLSFSESVEKPNPLQCRVYEVIPIKGKFTSL